MFLGIGAGALVEELEQSLITRPGAVPKAEAQVRPHALAGNEMLDVQRGDMSDWTTAKESLVELRSNRWDRRGASSFARHRLTSVSESLVLFSLC